MATFVGVVEGVHVAEAAEGGSATIITTSQTASRNMTGGTNSNS